jgi:hypothetical protein
MQKHRPPPLLREVIDRTLSVAARDERTEGGSGDCGWRLITATRKRKANKKKH